MYRSAFLTFWVLSFCLLLPAQESQIVYLSGTGSDQTVDWDFYCTGGRDSGVWTTIPVPSNWELQGFGTYNYGLDKNKSDEKGIYKHSFFVPSEWKGMVTELVFEGSMTDTEVKINGKPAGPVHRGAFYRFSYDITRLLRPGKENLLQVTVSKMSSDASVNAAERYADFWVFGGIFRPVYLRVMPAEHIERIAIDAGADGHFHADIYTQNLRKADKIQAVISPLSGHGRSFTFIADADKNAMVQTVDGVADHPDLWNPEFPNLYVVRFDLMTGDKVIHSVTRPVWLQNGRGEDSGWHICEWNKDHVQRGLPSLLLAIDRQDTEQNPQHNGCGIDEGHEHECRKDVALSPGCAFPGCMRFTRPVRSG